MLFINADDWGIKKQTTDKILVCIRQDRATSVSSMAFMEDSERSAELALEHGLDVGLHLNLTQELSSETVNGTLRNYHQAVVNYLKSWKMNQVMFNPILTKAFDYVFQAQWEEFYRLYGKEPARLDGHHHMHLCMNMLVSGNLPKGLKVRRNFTFYPNEKGPLNRLYRYLTDSWLDRRFKCTDYFFSIVPINQERLKRIILMSKSADVEIMVHPGVEKEYSYLLSRQWAALISE